MAAPAVVVQAHPITPEKDYDSTKEIMLLMDQEQVLSEYTSTMRSNSCCGMPVGGNKLTLTNQRVVVKYWTDMCCGSCEATMQEETFRYEDLSHITLNAGRKPRVLYWGIFSMVSAVICFIGAAASDDSNAKAAAAVSGVLWLFLGAFLLIRFFLGNKWAFLTLDFSKKAVSVGSWWNGRNSAYTIRELRFKREDARNAAMLLTKGHLNIIQKVI
mmetsp:Transcript_8804/g.18267  ORF Transcript_8804/g.18267 Transcript_8804/m.18267 type:complete len:215 (+) Transcript_8804:93-737(+)|eukprot:CAMPEP_0118958178 /NCGR_PEP_ID=MMETSP1169-20130426/62492_1 /TAXON_ID=36882 /ORGANISM="Pyramimonas obovata, Strain CCMP722" /LENGTH=214 /DNA_ID=CAMNT_0006906293 /DNA_START=82 /DNA_END=726 /DNA_ORIENTATION=-